MGVGRQSIVAKFSREAGCMFMHVVLLGVLTLVFYDLLRETDWTQPALAAFILAYPLRYAAATKLNTANPAFSWHGWMGADLLFLGVMGWTFNVLDSGGVVLAGLIVMSAALFVSPLIMARFNAAVIFLYAIMLNGKGEALDSVEVWLSEGPSLVVFAAVSMLVSASRMRTRSDQTALREVGRDLFERLHLNLAVLDDQDRFIMVNSRAVQTLEKSEKDLSDIKFHDLIAHHSELAVKLNREGAQSGMLTRKNGSLCPVAYEIVPLTVQGGVFGWGPSDELRDYQLVVFTDVTELVAGQEAVGVQKRNQTVNTMLEVFADGVRNPLAGISAYVQSLQRIEQMGLKDGEESDKIAIYQQMVQDIEDLDALLEQLMNNTRLTPDEVEDHFARLKAQRQQVEADDTLDGSAPLDG